MAGQIAWYAFCKIETMTMTLDIASLTLLFVTTVFALVMAFVWMFCEFERRFGKRLTAIALVRFGYRPDGTIDRNANRRD
jgi:hypothetical protein